MSALKHHIELKGHSHCVNCVYVMPDGVTIVSGSDDKTLKFWNSNDGRHREYTLPTKGIFTACP